MISNMADKIREKARSFLQIQPGQSMSINIEEMLDWEGNAIKNQIWYRGDSVELQQLYSQIQAPNTMFWKAVSTAGLEIRKIHTGLPGMIVDMLSWIVVSDMNQIKVHDERESLWDKLDQENDFKKILSEAIRDTLVVGDGAFKISLDPEISKLPIIEWYSGERVEFRRKRGRIREVVFYIPYKANNKEYCLEEIYGFGYVNYRLTLDKKEVPMDSLDVLRGLKPVEFDKELCLAYPLMFFESGKYKGRGKSIFDSKIDDFDSLDETWSQWMQALRQGRTKEYIPENLLPRNPNSGEVMKPNAFDFAYIQTESNMSEGAKREIQMNQPSIPHESYLATYSTALNQAMEGLISPSTMGIDVKKIDNAEAQREKEKVTLYTRNKMVDSLQKVLPRLIAGIFSIYDQMNGKNIKDREEIDVTFGEYANPSFESQIETVSKGKTSGIMSTEACVDELYGDSRDEEWKSKEVKRLKAEQGIIEMDEPSAGEEVD